MESWAWDLEASRPADDYELVLLGPCAHSVAIAGYAGKVRIPTPKILDITALMEQAAHRLDKFLIGQGVSALQPFVRELLVHALVSKFAGYSTAGTELSKAELTRLILDWIMVLYPQSVGIALKMQCDLLVDTIVMALPSAPSHDSFPLILPLTFVNGGVRTVVIEWVAIKVVATDHTKLYTPQLLIDLQKFIAGYRKLHAENQLGIFSEFPVPPGQAVTHSILFVQEEFNERYPFRPWSCGQHTLQIYMKYRDSETAILERTIDLEIFPEQLATFKAGMSLSVSLRKIDL